MLEEPFKFRLNFDEKTVARMGSHEAQAKAMMEGPLKSAFEDSFNLMITSLLSVPLDRPDQIMGLVAQMKGLFDVHGNMQDMIENHKIRLDAEKRNWPLESEKSEKA